jgi:hypothetical protein
VKGRWLRGRHAEGWKSSRSIHHSCKLFLWLEVEVEGKEVAECYVAAVVAVGGAERLG